MVQKEIKEVQHSDSAALDILGRIRNGDSVTITNRFGQESTGRAVLLGPHGWVLNMGGSGANPCVACCCNVVAVPRRWKGKFINHALTEEARARDKRLECFTV